MSEEQDKVVHEVDEIKEYDNQLPNWWLYTLYGAILFAAIYWFQYQVFRASKGPREQFTAEMAQVREAEQKAAAAERAKAPAAAELEALAKNADVVGKGKAIFTTNCAPCHNSASGAVGGGLVGPNLTDDAWINGGSADAIYNTINNGGRAGKGMQPWGPVLQAEGVKNVAAFVLSLRGTNVAGGKGPEGEKYVK